MEDYIISLNTLSLTISLSVASFSYTKSQSPTAQFIARERSLFAHDARHGNNFKLLRVMSVGGLRNLLAPWYRRRETDLIRGSQLPHNVNNEHKTVKGFRQVGKRKLMHVFVFDLKYSKPWGIGEFARPFNFNAPELVGTSRDARKLVRESNYKKHEHKIILTI